MKFKSFLMNELQERGFINQCSNAVGLDDFLCSNKKICVYLGADLTARSLHVGNLMTIMMLRLFAKYGHEIVFLLGGATTKIGDPTGRDDTRRILSDEEIEQNRKGIESCVKKIFNGIDVKFVNNADWFLKFGYIDFLREVGSHFTVNRMIAMDSVSLRLEREQAMSFVEFNYMLIQGYDFVHLNKEYGCNLQIGGSDQWGNIIQGVDLSRRIAAQNGNSVEELFGLTCPLLTKSDGSKMGKSRDGAIWLSSDLLSDFDYFQYFRNVADEDVKKMLLIFSDLPVDEIEGFCSVGGKDINTAKEKLAFEATKICRGYEAANSALCNANGSVLPLCEVCCFVSILDVCLLCNFASSKSQAKKLFLQNSVKVDGVFVDISFIFDKAGRFVVSCGKKQSFDLIVK